MYHQLREMRNGFRKTLIGLHVTTSSWRPSNQSNIPTPSCAKSYPKKQADWPKNRKSVLKRELDNSELPITTKKAELIGHKVGEMSGLDTKSRTFWVRGWIRKAVKKRQSLSTVSWIEIWQILYLAIHDGAIPNNSHVDKYEFRRPFVENTVFHKTTFISRPEVQKKNPKMEIKCKWKKSWLIFCYRCWKRCERVS